MKSFCMVIVISPKKFVFEYEFWISLNFSLFDERRKKLKNRLLVSTLADSFFNCNVCAIKELALPENKGITVTTRCYCVSQGNI